MDPYNNLRSYGEALIESIDPARAERAAVRALAAPSAGLSFRRRLVAIAAASATFITGNVGMAMAADQAAPGDLLFGLDRAYEQLADLIGFSGDHTAERLDEAAQLANAGRSVDALDAVIQQIQALQSEHDFDTAGLDTAVAAITAARDNALALPENSNESAAAATVHAKEIVTKVHALADAIQSGATRAEVRALIEELRDLARDKNNGNAFGREQNKGQGQPPEHPDNGGGLGNSG